MFCDGVVNLLRPDRNVQDKTRNFYDDFGTRIRFIRHRRGLTLGALGGGKPSTAKSWELGIKPRPDEWEAVANRLNLSVSLIFLGHPVSRTDYEFLAKYADEIERPAHGQKEPMMLEESAGPLSEPTRDQAAQLRANIEKCIRFAGGDTNRLGWLLEQMRVHMLVPAERWSEQSADLFPPTLPSEEHEEAVRRAVEKELHSPNTPYFLGEKTGGGT